MYARTLSPITARRLAVAAQQLDRPPETADSSTILNLIRRLGCVQLDPINVVARSPLLVLWSRLGRYRVADFEALLWQERALFEYWAHAASIVLVEDFPIHQQQMIHFSRGNGAWARRVRAWMAANDSFRRYMLDELATRGPLFANEFEDRAVTSWRSGGWSNSRNVSAMLGFLWEQGDITVTRREGKGFGLKKQFGLLEHHMPQWTNHEPLPRREAVRRAAQRALKALGVATPRHIDNHFIRGSYPGLDAVLAELEANGRIHPVTIRDAAGAWSGDWYIHSDTLPLLERVQGGDWQPRTTLLSPFDNLICDRDRTEQLFDFYYRVEIYTPKAKRQYGYYVLPILHDGRLIGRIDPRIDRKSKTLHVHAVHAEPDAPTTAAPALAETIGELGRFLGARRVVYDDDALPPRWRAALLASQAADLS